MAAGGARRARQQRQLTRQLTKCCVGSLSAEKVRGPSGSKLAAAEAAASTDEEVVCEGEKTREERDAELHGEAVSLDE